MKTWILNFLATRIGAALAPVILSGIASMVTAILAQAPWLAPYATEKNCLLVVGFLIAVGMSAINYATTSRAFKYAEPVQKLLETLAKQLGVTPPKIDGVIAEKTAGTATEIRKVVLTEPGKPWVEGAEVRRAEPVLRPPGARGGLNKGYVLGYALIGMALFSVVLLFACTPQDFPAPPRPAAPAATPKPFPVSTPAPHAYPDITDTPDLALPLNYGGRWLQMENETHTAQYNLPAWQRLLFSLRPWVETGSQRATVRVDESAANVSGQWKDNKEWNVRQLIPDSYAVGFAGGLQ